MSEHMVSIEEMRNNLKDCIGLNTPLYIKKKNNEVVVGYIRGFADNQCNIILISDKQDSMSMRIVELNNIYAVQCPVFTTSGVNAAILRPKA
jgi:small nuclear ribonucleoprotein (snRNP)-like protein